jgi:hypothetical protein
MSQRLKGLKDGAEATVRDIRRRTRKQYSAEEKIRIVVAALAARFRGGCDSVEVSCALMLWKERAPAVGSFARVQILLDRRLNEDEPLHTESDTH